MNFGVTAAKALASGTIDGFWANGMGAEVAVTSGTGVVVLDVRRGDGPPGAFHYTHAALAATDALVERTPGIAAAAVRAIVRAHARLRADVSLATTVARRWFPDREAGLIATLIERDLPYYDAAIRPEAVAGMNAFARACGLLSTDPAYDAVVATQFASYWQS